MGMTLDTINRDEERNKHPKNRLFIYLFRFGHYFYGRNPKSPLTLLIRLLMKITINQNNHFPLQAKIGKGIRLPHLMGIVISSNVVIGEDCTIFHQVTIGSNDLIDNNAACIGDGCYIGAGAKIIGAVNIGNHVRIGANAVVTKDIPDNSTVVGFNNVITKS